jgi:hypothetical protein
MIDCLSESCRLVDLVHAGDDKNRPEHQPDPEARRFFEEKPLQALQRSGVRALRAGSWSTARHFGEHAFFAAWFRCKRQDRVVDAEVMEPKVY